MPTQEEIDKLAGDSPAAPGTPSDQKPQVTEEDYRKAVEQKDEAVKFAKRRDDEIHTLRKENEELRKGITPRKSEVIEDEEEDKGSVAEQVAAEIKKQEARIAETVESKMTVMGQAQKLQKDMEKAVSDMPFINPAELLAFMGQRGSITLDEAIALRYAKELTTFKKQPEIPETDRGGRTLAVSASRPSDAGVVEKAMPYPMDLRSNSRNFRSFVADSLQKAADNLAGNR